jgi:hypothetical protein
MPDRDAGRRMHSTPVSTATPTIKDGQNTIASTWEAFGRDRSLMGVEHHHMEEQIQIPGLLPLQIAHLIEKAPR